MSQSCTGCLDEAKERNRDMNNLLIQAKNKAIEDKKPKAICQDEVEGTLFITDAITAFREHFNIKHIISGLS